MIDAFLACLKAEYELACEISNDRNGIVWQSHRHINAQCQSIEDVQRNYRVFKAICDAYLFYADNRYRTYQIKSLLPDNYDGLLSWLNESIHDLFLRDTPNFTLGKYSWRKTNPKSSIYSFGDYHPITDPDLLLWSQYSERASLIWVRANLNKFVGIGA